MSVVYKGTTVSGSKNVVANPTLAGTEDSLSGIQIGNTKYKVDGGGISEITSSTETSLTGLLQGDGETVSAETRFIPTVEVTSAEYAALEQAGTVDPDVMYVITDDEGPSDTAYSKSQTDAKLGAVEDSIAIVATGNTHIAIAEGQYVYVKNHNTLNEGMYKASAAIAADATLSTSNLTSVSNGVANDLKSALTTPVYIKDPFETVNTSIIDSINQHDSYLIVMGKIVYFSIRFTVKANTTGSTTAMRFKSQYQKYLPVNYDISSSSTYDFTNGFITTVHETWSNATSALIYINSDFEVGLSGGCVANRGYIGTGVYFLP